MNIVNQKIIDAVIEKRKMYVRILWHLLGYMVLLRQAMSMRNQDAYDELCKLREPAKLFLASEKRFQRVNELVDKAKVSYANANLHEELGQVRLDTFGVMYYLMDAIMLFHGRYF